MKIVLIASQKGGVGKTTAAINLAHGLSGQLPGKARCLIVDADPNGSALASLRLKPSGLESLEAALTGRWAPLPAAPGVDVARLETLGPEGGRILKQFAASEAARGYAVAVVDSQPYAGAESHDLIAAADALLAVLRAEALAIKTLPFFLKSLQGVAAPGAFRGLVLGHSADRESSEAWEQSLRERFGRHILTPAIPWDDAIQRAMDGGVAAVARHPSAPASRAFRELAGRLAPSLTEKAVRHA